MFLKVNLVAALKHYSFWNN